MNDSTSESAVSSTPVDISRKLLSLTEQIIFKVAFGMTDKREQLGNFETIIFEAINMLSSFSATDYFPGVGWIIDRLTGLHGTLEKSFHDLDTFYQKIIDEHLDTQRLKSGHEDIIDVLLKLERDGLNSVNLTKDHIKATLMETEVQVENQQEHEQDEQNRQQQNSNVSSVRVSFTMISDWSSPELMDDVWQCIISLLICWFLAVSLMVVVGFNGKRDWPIGPNFSRLLTANSLFVSEIIVIAEGYYPTISCWFFRRESKKKHMKLFLVLLK
ncbi:hypothetical protein MKX01_038303 [Papaver californicum]|nr:hypothetical protein MKX01_038303 [Papaver californicum]